MSEVLYKDLDFCFAYLDDILIFSPSWEEHINHLSWVFERMKKADLKIKLSKCQLFKLSLHYLGHAILDAGIRPLPEKREVVGSTYTTYKYWWSLSLSRIDRLLLQIHPIICGYGQTFKYLLCEKTLFVWSEECQSCFGQLKESLCKSQILQHPDPAKPDVLFCGASNYAFTGVLTQAQDQPEDLRSIAYTSGSFSPVQQCWCTTERNVMLSTRAFWNLISTYEEVTVHSNVTRNHYNPS